MSNYPPGAEYDPNAPWKEETELISVKVIMEIETELEIPVDARYEYSNADIENTVYEVINSGELSDLSDWEINLINVTI